MVNLTIAEGATTPETLRHKNRYRNGHSGKSGLNLAAEGVSDYLVRENSQVP